MLMTTDETTLPAARRAFAAAVAALINPHPDRDSVYLELRHAIHGHRAGSTTGRVAQSQPPLWIDGVDLAHLIDTTVKTWERDGSGPTLPTINRLRRLNERTWRPQDTALVESMTGELLAWVKRYETLVNDKPLTLPNPCPRCDRKFAYRTIDGEQVRVAALQITLQRCVCMACHATWPPERYEWLSRLLGYEPLPGVLDR